MVIKKKRKIATRDMIADPFRELAVGLSITEEQSEIWEEEPISIQEFIESKYFLDQKWNGRTGCRPKILEILKEISKPNVREAMLILGKGSGKDYLSAILHLYGIYVCICMISPQSFYGLAPRSKIYFVNTARNDTQAKKVFFEEFKGLLEGCAWFEGKFSEPGVTSVEFSKRIEAISANSQAFGWLGFNTIQWVGDELAFFLSNDKDEESESRAEECWEAAYGSCETRFGEYYKMIGITTPRYDDDFVMKKFGELKDREDGYTIQAATWDIHPNRTKNDFRHALARDYRRAMRDFGAIPSGVIESFWADPDFIENNVCEICRQCPVYQNRSNGTDIFECWDYDDCKAEPYMGNGQWREWFKPDTEKDYYMHFDLSIKKDRLGFTLAHINDYIKVELDLAEIKDKAEKEGTEIKDIDEEDRYEEKPLIKIDSVSFISPASERDPLLIKRGEIYYTGVLKYIILNLRQKGFNIEFITFDQFQSHHLRQSLEDEGIETDLISLDRNDSIPVQAKLALVENRVEYPYSRLLCNEAKHLKYIQGKKVDHARKKSKDLWDGFAGAIHNCEELGGDTSGWIGLEETDDDD